MAAGLAPVSLAASEGGHTETEGEAPAEGGGADAFVDSFAVDPESLSSIGRNDYFILEPGYTLSFAGKDEDGEATLVITVLAETRRMRPAGRDQGCDHMPAERDHISSGR